MIVTTVSAMVRYSQDTGKGAWKVIELGAEGSIGQKDNWKQAQSELYYQLGAQLRSLWSGNSKTASEPNGNHPDRAHWCEQHQQEFKRRTKAGTVWYSRKAADGSWCNEPE